MHQTAAAETNCALAPVIHPQRDALATISSPSTPSLQHPKQHRSSACDLLVQTTTPALPDLSRPGNTTSNTNNNTTHMLRYNTGSTTSPTARPLVAAATAAAILQTIPPLNNMSSTMQHQGAYEQFNEGMLRCHISQRQGAEQQQVARSAG